MMWILLVLLSITIEAADTPVLESNKPTMSKRSDTHKFSGLKLKGEVKKPRLKFQDSDNSLEGDLLTLPEDFNEQQKQNLEDL